MSRRTTKQRRAARRRKWATGGFITYGKAHVVGYFFYCYPWLGVPR